MNHIKNQKGDTILIVMILAVVIAVAGLVSGISTAKYMDAQARLDSIHANTPDPPESYEIDHSIMQMIKEATDER